MDHYVRPALALALLALGLWLGACRQVDRYLSGIPEDALVAAAVERWTARGRPFLEGLPGPDTVASVSPTGARSWQVAVIPVTGGAPVVWSLDIVGAEVLPTFAGEVFPAWLDARSRELGLRTVVPPPTLALIASGEIQGVGELEVRYGPASRTNRRTGHHIAVLLSRPAGPTWTFGESDRSIVLLLQALRSVAENAIHQDPRVRTCLGSQEPADSPRSAQLRCLREVWREDFRGN